MRRKAGVLLPIELEILEAAASSAASKDPWLHGYALAKLLGQNRRSKQLTAHGTLYKALARLATAGLLENQWEDPNDALAEGRPRRRLYRITGLGERALVDHRFQAEASRRQIHPRISPA
jgi:PadR family transcriptional regulator PadR